MPEREEPLPSVEELQESLPSLESKNEQPLSLVKAEKLISSVEDKRESEDPLQSSVPEPEKPTDELKESPPSLELKEEPPSSPDYSKDSEEPVPSNEELELSFVAAEESEPGEESLCLVNELMDSEEPVPSNEELELSVVAAEESELGEESLCLVNEADESVSPPADSREEPEEPNPPAEELTILDVTVEELEQPKASSDELKEPEENEEESLKLQCQESLSSASGEGPVSSPGQAKEEPEDLIPQVEELEIPAVAVNGSGKGESSPKKLLQRKEGSVNIRAKSMLEEGRGRVEKPSPSKTATQIWSPSKLLEWHTKEKNDKTRGTKSNAWKTQELLVGPSVAPTYVYQEKSQHLKDFYAKHGSLKEKILGQLQTRQVSVEEQIERVNQEEKELQNRKRQWQEVQRDLDLFNEMEVLVYQNKVLALKSTNRSRPQKKIDHYRKESLMLVQKIKILHRKLSNKAIKNRYA